MTRTDADRVGAEPGRVWVIEQGSYSDYRVVGVYSTRKDAARIAKKMNASHPYEKATVSEWPLNPGVDALNQGLSRFFVLMLRDGSVETQREDDSGWKSGELASSFWIWERTKAPAYRGKGIPDALNATVWARDMEHAVKITNDTRLLMIAEGTWKP